MTYRLPIERISVRLKQTKQESPPSEILLLYLLTRLHYFPAHRLVSPARK